MSTARWRADTPGLPGLVHLNNAGAGLMPAPVLSAIQSHLDLEATAGGYEAADLAAPAIADAYRAIGDLIGAPAANIAIVENATVAVAQALSAFDWQPGDVVITTEADYVSNQLMLLSLAARRGIEIVRAPDLPEGGVDPAAVERLVRARRPALLLVSWIPTNSGLIQDAAAVGAIARRHQVPYLLDACQAVGQLPIDVTRIGCDFLAATGRKFLRGPRGIGFLYVSDRILETGRYPLFIDLRGGTWTAADRFEPMPGARRFENWEYAYALVLGLGAAARYAIDAAAAGALDATAAIARYAQRRMAAVEGLRLLDRGHAPCAIITASVPRIAPAQLVAALRETGVNTSWFPRSAAVIDMDRKGIDAGWRVSPHYFNTEGDIDRLIDALTPLLTTT